jgi:hypothetical protein
MAISSPLRHTAIIYALVNPIDDSIFYVGSTRGSLAAALRRHIRPNTRIFNRDKAKVISAIQKKGKQPLIAELQRCLVSLQFEIEKTWRHRMAKKYWLTNACGIHHG